MSQALNLKLDILALFLTLFLWIVFSVFIERLTFLGQPNISFTRFAFAAVLVFALYLNVLLNTNFKIIGTKSILGLAFYSFFCLFSVAMALLTSDSFSSYSFYLLYSHFVLWGYWVFSSETEFLDKILLPVFIIAGVIGTAMVFAGPDMVQAVGIGALEGRWGQFSVTDENGVADALRLFRSFSIFSDHQTYSGFLQVMAFYFRFRHYQTKRKCFLIFTFLAFFFNIATFSTTGLLVIGIVLLSYLKWYWIAVFGAFTIFIVSNIALANPELFALLFHTSSLDWRIIYIERMIAAINFYPQAHLFQYANFTSDNYVLWGAYKYGYIYGFIYLLILIAYFTGALFSPKNRNVLLLFGIIIFINTMTNGIIFSTPNNIITPIILGLLLKDSVTT